MVLLWVHIKCFSTYMSISMTYMRPKLCDFILKIYEIYMVPKICPKTPGKGFKNLHQIFFEIFTNFDQEKPWLQDCIWIYYKLQIYLFTKWYNKKKIIQLVIPELSTMPITFDLNRKLPISKFSPLLIQFYKRASNLIKLFGKKAEIVKSDTYPYILI